MLEKNHRNRNFFLSLFIPFKGMGYMKSIGFFSFNLDFIRKFTQTYFFYIPMHKERERCHKLHNNDLILSFTFVVVMI
jgi:hypothetical protein